MKISHVHRLLRLITLLQSEEEASVSQLADLLKVSRRTVFRDIASLKRAEIPIRFDNASRHYVIRSDFFLPPLSLTLREARSLTLLARLAVDVWNVPFPADIETAVEKIRCALAPQMKTSCAEALRAMDARSAPLQQSSHSTTVFHVVWDAAIAHRVLDVRWEAPPLGREVSMRFHPYRIIWTAGGWHVAGYSERDRAMTLLNVDWIIHAAPLDEQFAPVPFSAEEFFGNAWKMEKGSQRHHVRIRFTAGVALAVDDVQWHPTQQTEFLEDGSLLLEVDVDGLDEICSWIMGYGPEALVEAPTELRELVWARSTQTSLQYRDKRVTSPLPVSLNPSSQNIWALDSISRFKEGIGTTTADIP